ncbi:heavy metal-binding domain-containing protein [Amycolatopsis vastitatis]|uniref:heavy metal-binding domain-containing protein n=1 Tax=Amycolatopsis vastitatis TaxID=1905142 RepID=UPI001F0B19E3|nr:heavy metal-binding domain-containing protein [Amycolatopsis vastitatis]
MPQWEGHALPPAARARFDRFSPTGPKTSLLGVPGAVGAAAAGFTPVGDVMGCVVHQVGFTESSSWAADRIKQLALILRQGYETALDRLTEEAAGLGADGVLGIEFEITSPDGMAQEFVALGTAVRAETEQRPRRLFTTELPGQDVGKLMQAGWVPARVAVGVAGRAFTDYYWRRPMVAAWAGNTEIAMATELATAVRAAARAQFAEEIRDCGADGGIVSDLRFEIWPVQDVAVAAIATVTGTAITRFHEGPATPAGVLRMLPLNRS